ncbi:MAG: hypothetical protein U0168_02625 [Nannocystaceae bacterium]
MGLGDRDHGRARVGHQRAAGLGQARAEAPAIEQARIELLLEPANRSGQRRLRHVGVPRRRGEGALLDHEQEVAHRLEHNQRLSKCAETFMGVLAGPWPC